MVLKNPFSRRKRRGKLFLVPRNRRKDRVRRKILGEGWQGRVYSKNAFVVRKEFKKSHPFRNIRRSVETESTIQRRLSRKGIAPKVVGTGKGYIDMERVRGKTLTAHTANNPRRQRKYGRKLARTVQKMHDIGVSHRDLHGGNVLITPSGKVKVIDYGFARDRGRPLTMRERRRDYKRVLRKERGNKNEAFRQSFERNYRP